jgi:hypothetical protein
LALMAAVRCSANANNLRLVVAVLSPADGGDGGGRTIISPHGGIGGVGVSV